MTPSEPSTKAAVVALAWLDSSFFSSVDAIVNARNLDRYMVAIELKPQEWGEGENRKEKLEH